MQNAPQSSIEILRLPPENTNSVLVRCGDDCVIFDAWGRADDWIKILDSRGLHLRAIYSTHGHPDHISAAPALAAHYDVPWHLARADWDLIGWGGDILDYFNLPRIVASRPPLDITPGDYEVLPGVWMTAIATPGHSRGAMVFYFADNGVLLMGDTLFRDGVGRYDLPGGDVNSLRQSIARIYDMNLADGVYVVHGHGPDSTIGILRAQNQWFGNI